MKSKGLFRKLFVVIFTFVTILNSFTTGNVALADSAQILTNGSFETSSFVTWLSPGWSTYSTSNGSPSFILASADSIIANDGTNVMKIAPNGGFAIFRQRANVVIGQEYTLNYNYKGQAPEGYRKILWGCVNGFGNDDDPSHVPAHTYSSIARTISTGTADINGWVKVTEVFTAPTNTININFRYGTTNIGYLDNVSLIGQVPATPTPTLEPTPTPTATPTPTPKPTLVPSYVVTNGSFENIETVSYPNPGWNVFSGSSGTPVFLSASADSIIAFDGSNVAKFQPQGGTAILRQRIDVIPGQEYIVEYSLKGKNPDGYTKIVLGCINGWGNDEDPTHIPAHTTQAIQLTTTSGATDANGWVKYSSRFTAISSQINIQFRYDNWGSTPVDAGYLDGVTIANYVAPTPTPEPTPTPTSGPNYDVTNGSFEVDTFVNLPFPGWNKFSPNGISIINAADDSIIAQNGSKIAKFAPLNDASILSQLVDVINGQQYVLTYYSKGTSPAGYPKVLLGCVNGWGNDTNSLHTPSDNYFSIPNIITNVASPDSNGWVKVTCKFTAISDKVNLNFRYDNWTSSPATPGYLDNISISPFVAEATPTATPALYNVTVNVPSAAKLINTGDISYNDSMNTSAITTITVKTSYLAIQTIATVNVDPDAKTGVISNLPVGTYVLSITRNGYLTRHITITIENSDLVLNNKFLLGGDVFKDGIVDGSDSETLFAGIGFSYGDVNYNPASDLYADGIIDGTDSEILLAELGTNTSTYGESVNYKI